MQQDCLIVDYRWDGANHTQPDATEISQIEDVVKLG